MLGNRLFAEYGESVVEGELDELKVSGSGRADQHSLGIQRLGLQRLIQRGKALAARLSHHLFATLLDSLNNGNEMHVGHGHEIVQVNGTDTASSNENQSCSYRRSIKTGW